MQPASRYLDYQSSVLSSTSLHLWQNVPHPPLTIPSPSPASQPHKPPNMLIYGFQCLYVIYNIYPIVVRYVKLGLAEKMLI